MNKTTIGILSFIAGVAAGGAVVWKLLKTKYEQIAQEEIDAVREAYAEYLEDDGVSAEPEEEKIEEVPVDPEKEEYEAIIQEENYAKKKKGGKKKVSVNKNVRVISPKEFEELEYDGYDIVQLTYYAGDGVLADDYDQVIEDVEDKVGAASLKTFGEYDDNIVYVANDASELIYEICLDNGKYSNVVKVDEED